MKTKEDWINKTLESLDSLQEVPLSPSLTEKLWRLVPTSSQKIRPISSQVKWSVAAGILLLIGINIFSLIQFRQHSSQTLSNKGNPIFIEYFAFLDKE